MHEPSPIKGYQKISEERLSMVNFNKIAEEGILRALDSIPENIDVDTRWLNIARTHIEQGFMALNRAILRPQRLKGGDLDG